MIIDTLHPEWTEQVEWTKWSLAYRGNREFINNYLYKMSARESDTDLISRKLMTFCPRFAGAAVDEIKNAIYQRMSDISRIGGPLSYQKATVGELGGVDFQGNNMDTFIGMQVLPEMLVMKTAGVLVDAPQYAGETLLDKGDLHPYLCFYDRRSIKNYSYSIVNGVKKLKSLCLFESTEDFDEYGLTNGYTNRCRLLQRNDFGVLVTFFDGSGKETEKIQLKIKEIPFVLFQIDKSLMEVVADYQIALLNMESADVSYAVKGNFPFYYEFYDKTEEPIHMKPVAAEGSTGTASEAVARGPERAVGSNLGRRFPAGLTAPGFINPSSETLIASMKKEEQLKDDIRRLVNLNLTQATIKSQSGDSKREDQRGLDSSLSALGFILQKCENEVARFWAYFEGESNPATIKYPENYSLKSEEDRQNEAESLEKRREKIPSPTYRKEVSKQIVDITIGHKITRDTLETIKGEIDSAETLTTDPNHILLAQKQGLLSDVTASTALGFDGEKEIPQAKKDRAEKIAMAMEAQGGMGEGRGAAAGAPELGGKDGSEEKDGLPKRGAAERVPD